MTRLDISSGWDGDATLECMRDAKRVADEWLMTESGQVFANRGAAGRALAKKLARLQLQDPVVLALPRGGVPVAVEIAKVLRAPLDLIFVRKIGVPGEPELAAAAVVDGGEPELVFNDAVVEREGISRREIQLQAARELEEIERRRGVYLAGRERVPLDGRTLILVDDGIATGASVRAALVLLRRKRPRRLLLAVPVAARDTIEALGHQVDEVVCLVVPGNFYAVGAHYRDFHQVSDAEVARALRQADELLASRASEMTGSAGKTPGA